MLLGNFADKRMAVLDDAQLDRLEALLEEQDIDLVAWIGSIRPAPAHLDNDVMTLLRKLDYLDR